MEKLYKKENISKFCERLLQSLENGDEDELRSFMTVLKVLICGSPRSNERLFYLERLSPENCVAAVVNCNSSKQILEGNPTICLQLINSLLDLPRFSAAICRALQSLISCLEPASLRKGIATRLFEHHDFHKLPSKTIVGCLREDSTELELLLLKICLHGSEDDVLKHRFNQWVTLSLDPDIFLTVAAILNEFLLRLKRRTTVLSVVGAFVAQVRGKCNQRNLNFVNLYPREWQTVVTLMMTVDPIDFDDYEHLSSYSDFFQLKFKEISRTDPTVALLLTTHFPHWNQILQ